MSEIKEEVKPIDIKAQADLDRLKDKYKDQKTNKDKETPKVDPEVVNQINPQEIDQELEMLNGIYFWRFLIFICFLILVFIF